MKMSVLITAIFILLSESFAFSADVKIIWNPNNEPDLEGYRVYYKYYKKDKFCPPYDFYGYITVKELDDPAEPNFTFTGLKNNQKYYFAVTAYDTKGLESYYSNLGCVKTGDILKPCDSQNDGEINFEGDWLANIEEEFKIKGLGSETGESNGIFNFTYKDSSNGVYELILDNSASSQEAFSGMYYVVKKGKKISWCLDTDSSDNFEIYLKNRFIKLAQKEGLIFDSDAIEFRDLSVDYKKMKISKKTGSLKFTFPLY